MKMYDVTRTDTVAASYVITIAILSQLEAVYNMSVTLCTLAVPATVAGIHTPFRFEALTEQNKGRKIKF